MQIRVLSAADVWRALPIADAITATRRAFLALAAGAVQAPPRVPLVDGDTTTLLMAASGEPGRIAKVVNVWPANAARGLATTTGVVTVLDPATGHVRGICDGGALTALRTGAVAGLATDLLARPDAAIGAVVGAGGQAETQVLAIDRVRGLREIRVAARSIERAHAFVERLRPTVRADLVVAASTDEAVAGADVVCAATSSARPVFDGERLRLGAHVNGIGSFRLAMRELDQRTIARAARIVVDLRASALHEAGELVAAQEAGVTSAADWLELGELLADPARGRQSPDEVTLFKSVGHAVQDLFAACLAIERAEREGLGHVTEI
ncbi:MAG: ornithine cyclodeaminase family protein [Planctomycetota bacterium]